MNLVQFLNKVDEIADRSSKDELLSFVHETARLLEEECREEFITRLEQAAEGQFLEELRKEDAAKCLGNMPGGGLAENEMEEYHRISAELDRIEEGELSVGEEYNDQYDDWNSNPSEEFLYSDPEGIGGILEKACSFVHKCMDRCAYSEGAEIGERLFFLPVFVDSDYGSGDISLSDMEDNGLLNVDLKKVALDSLYCIYHAYPLEEKPEEIYDLFMNAEIEDLKLEDLLMHGSEELEDVDDFLDLWISYLQDKPERKANQLFLEAISLKGDTDFAIAVARVSAGTHPELYLRLLDQELPSGTKLELGLEALKLVDSPASVRSKIALRTADYAVDEGRADEAEMCRLEAFRSMPRPIHYLRVLLNAGDKNVARTQLEEIWEKTDRLEGNDFYAVEFLRGNFEKVLSGKRGMGMQDSLGWSGCFMKQGFALFCMYLYEGTHWPAGIRRMEEIVSDTLDFDWNAYSEGLGTKEKEEDEAEKEGIYPYFLKWKALTPMRGTDIDHALRRLEQMVELRVKGIMEANNRYYYGECAAFIAALGEVKESRGEKGEKQRLMRYYQGRYSRRWLFRNELRGFGLLM